MHRYTDWQTKDLVKAVITRAAKWTHSNLRRWWKALDADCYCSTLSRQAAAASMHWLMAVLLASVQDWMRLFTSAC